MATGVPAPPSSPGAAAPHGGRPAPAPQPPRVPAPRSSGAPGATAAHGGRPAPAPQPPLVPAPPSSGAPGAAAAQAGRPAPASAPQPPRRPMFHYAGVERAPDGGWTARVPVDAEGKRHRVIGPFADDHAAALAHDRVAIAFQGDSARANFRAAFHPIEQRFLRLCRTREGQIDVCALVADGTYEDRYATFLRAVLRLDQWGQEYTGFILDFFIDRAAEIGEAALAEGADEALAARFVEMHRNKAVHPAWRAWYMSKALQKQKQKQNQTQFMEMEMRRRQRQQQGQGEGGCATAVQQQLPNVKREH
ncbi:hypothetical protein BS78_01G470200 [Paspalum vaginatum]|nr:hypothetical protein BS78_01G470200 [Paspalum vaginatum]